MRALLVHGMGRTPLSMMTLARALRRADIVPTQFGYSAALETVDQIVARLRGRLEATATTSPSGIRLAASCSVPRSPRSTPSDPGPGG
jgi:hypothetical protein